MGTSKSVCVRAGNIDEVLRNFNTPGVDPERTKDNIIYKNVNLLDVYRKLFTPAIEQHDKAQKRKDRQYGNAETYFKKIMESKQEKPYYEAVIMFGNKDTMGTLTQNGQIAKKMLDEYMQDFQKRNPNLYVFCATMHLDEATPHLHIDFVPFATNQKRGLSTRTTLKGALVQQGAIGKSATETDRQQWALIEKKVMDKILKNHGLEPEDIGAHYKHMKVEKFRAYAQELERIEKRIEFLQLQQPTDLTEKEIRMLQADLIRKKQETENLKSQKETASEVQKFNIPDEEKLNYMYTQMEKANIDFTEDIQGFTVSKINSERVRDIEKSYKPKAKHNNIRNVVRDDIDKLIYAVSTFDELLDKLREQGYQVKRGEHIAVKPQGGERFIRLRSLGADYTEYTLRRRVDNNRRFENELKPQLEKSKGMERNILQTEYKIITLIYQQKKQPYRYNPNKVWSIKNDYHINQLVTCLNLVRQHGIYNGDVLSVKMEDLKAKMDSLNAKISEKNNLIADGEDIIKKAKWYFDNIGATDQRTKIRLAAIRDIFDEFNISAPEHALVVKEKVETITAEKAELQQELKTLKIELKSYDKLNEIHEQIKDGSYIQHLINLEIKRRAENNDTKADKI